MDRLGAALLARDGDPTVKKRVALLVGDAADFRHR